MLCLSGFELYSRWVPLFRVISYNAFWKFLRLGNSAWDFFSVKVWSKDFFGFWFLPYSIIPVTWNPKCPLLGDHTCHILNGVCPLVPVLTPAYNSTVPEASVLLPVCWPLLLRLSFQPGLVHYRQKSIVYWPSHSILRWLSYQIWGLLH